MPRSAINQYVLPIPGLCQRQSYKRILHDWRCDVRLGRKGRVEGLASVATVGDSPRRGIGTIVLASVHIHAAIRQFDGHAFVRMERVVGRAGVDRAKLPGSAMIIAINKMHTPMAGCLYLMIARNEQSSRVRPTLQLNAMHRSSRTPVPLRLNSLRRDVSPLCPCLAVVVARRNEHLGITASKCHPDSTR